MKLHSPLARRRGLTLTEALVAMFIAAIGMIALLTLFPLGALQMAQAIKDARCTEAAINAESTMRAHWRIEMIEKGSDTAVTTAMATGNPVFVDPIGVDAGLAGTVGGQAGLVRRTLTTATGLQRSLQFCSQLDDMTFNESGVPVVTGGRIERAGRYNWSAILQRTTVGVAEVSNLTVLVFDGRAPGYAAPNAEVPYPGWDETTTTAPFPPAAPDRRYSLITPGSTTMTLKFAATAAAPPLAKGRWVGVYTPTTPGFLTFHRVVSVTETTENRNFPPATDLTVYTLELQTPVSAGHAGGIGSTAIVFAGLAEVFERPTLTGY